MSIASRSAQTAARGLTQASKAAFRAAENVESFKVPLKHLPSAGGRWAQFAEGVDPTWAIRQALMSPNAAFLPNNVSGAFRVVTNLGFPVGAAGERAIRVIVGWDGKIWTAFPVHSW
jgi:hypothetical protein